VAPRSPLWRNGDFLLLWSAQSVSQFGSQISQLALPLVAILVLHSSTFAVAALNVVEFLPFLLLSLPAGVWVDRLRRRRILVVADWGRAAALGSIPVTYAAGGLTLGQLYGVAFATGCLTVFFDVAYQSYLPSLVERDELSDGNSKLEASRATAQVGGPGLAGLLVSALRAPYAVAFDAASFVASALLMTAVRREEELPDLEASPRRPMKVEVREGLAFVLRNPLLRAMLVFVAVSNFCSTMIGAIILVFSVRVLHLRAETIGLILSLASLGTLAGALLGPRIARRLGIGPALVLLAAGGAAWLFVPAAGGGTAIPFLVLAPLIFGFAAVAMNVTGISLYQAITPARLLGRVTASRRFVVWGVIPIGGLVGGALGSSIGLRPTLWIAAAGAAAAFLPLLFSPLRRVYTLEDAERFTSPA
jgi:MFS family permease